MIIPNLVIENTYITIVLIIPTQLLSGMILQVWLLNVTKTYLQTMFSITYYNYNYVEADSNMCLGAMDSLVDCMNCMAIYSMP